MPGPSQGRNSRELSDAVKRRVKNWFAVDGDNPTIGIQQFIGTLILVIPVWYYFLALPEPVAKSAIKTPSIWLVIAILAIETLIFGISAIPPLIQVHRRQARARRLGWFALGFLALLSAYVGIFASTYWLAGNAKSPRDRTCLNQKSPLTKVDALYFASSIYTTTAMGDLHPESQRCRALVTLQEWSGMVMIGFVLGAGITLVSSRDP